jgi:hypothetical protein
VVLGDEPLVSGARRIWIEVDVYALDQVCIIDGERRAKSAAWGLAAAPRDTVLTDAFASALDHHASLGFSQTEVAVVVDGAPSDRPNTGNDLAVFVDATPSPNFG